MGAHPVSVTGGAGGITAACDEIAAMGRTFGAAAEHALRAAFVLHAYLVDPAIAATAVLDPAGYGAFEADLLGALDGLHGLGWAGARAGMLAVELRAAAAGYAAADDLYRHAHDEVAGLIGLPAALAAAGAALARTRDPVLAAESAVAADPAAADTAIELLDLPVQLHALALALPDGHGVAEPLGRDTGRPAACAPRSLADIVRDLGVRDDQADTEHGAIDVRILTMPDGTRRAIVDVTGTKSWTPLPTADVTSLTTNGRALFGEPTAYEHGVLAAMLAAGIRPDEDVMLVGHSEGGMVAVEAARQAIASGRFRVTHVVTAGSPIGRTVGALPRSVQVLALESSRDVVPHLDGAANPDEPNVTTVTGARGDGTIVGDHAIATSYLPLAQDAQASRDRSIRAFLRSAGGYLRARSVRTTSFRIVRRYSR